MNAADAHANCFPCQRRREHCIYRYLGSCKFDEPEDTAANEEGQKGAAAQQKETNERMLDQAAMVLAEDQMLASTVLKEEVEHHQQPTDWSKLL
jgi:hypothetical protein